MRKILTISQKNKKSIFFRLSEKIFPAEIIICTTGIDAERIIRTAQPDFLLLDVIKPVNGEDLMNTLRSIDGNVRLRVAIFSLTFTNPHILSKIKYFFKLPRLKRAS